MVRLNLLPWRERQRLAAVRRLQLGLLGSLLLALCGVMMLDYLARQRLQQQATAIAARTAGIAGLDAQLEKLAAAHQAREGVMARTAALAALSSDQYQVPRMFAELEQALPSGLQLTELSVRDGQLQLVGLAASSAVVAQFMRDLQRSRLLDDVALKRVRAGSTGDEFLLLARLSARTP